MSRSGKAKTDASWRNLRQSNPRKITSQAVQQKRLQFLLRVIMLLFVVVALLAGVFSLRYFGRQLSQPAQVDVTERELDLVFQTDGVLLPEWFRREFQEWLFMDARDIDVRSLKQALEERGQVASAFVRVELPFRLIIDVRERVPLLRVRVRSRSGGAELYLVGRDGNLYSGAGYPVETLKALPGVAGLKLRRFEGQFLPIEGIEELAALLEEAKEKIPAIYRHWRLVDVSDWEPNAPYRTSLIRVRSTHIQEIVFGTIDFERQIERLAVILERIQQQQIGQPAFIDLSYPEEAVIRYN
jgi:cell division septal protein FtsQ